MNERSFHSLSSGDSKNISFGFQREYICFSGIRKCVFPPSNLRINMYYKQGKSNENIANLNILLFLISVFFFFQLERNMI